MTLQELFDRQAMTRRPVTFLEESALAEARKKEREWHEIEDGDSTWKKIGKTWLFVNPYYQLSRLTTKSIQAYWEAKKSGLDILLVPSNLANDLKLPPNHPQPAALYAAHPVDNRSYVPVSDFHRFMFNHKLSEMTRLLAHLGAEQIKAEHIRGYGRKAAVDAGIAIPEAGVGIGAGGGVSSAQGEQTIFSMELSGNTTPCLPEGLVWFDHEPTWQAVAEQRMKFGLKTFDLRLDYTDDFGVNAELKVNAEQAGFNIGGTFERHESTSWRFSGRFAD